MVNMVVLSVTVLSPRVPCDDGKVRPLSEAEKAAYSVRHEERRVLRQISSQIQRCSERDDASSTGPTPSMLPVPPVLPVPEGAYAIEASVESDWVVGST